jgi:hypothetical protein
MVRLSLSPSDSPRWRRKSAEAYSFRRLAASTTLTMVSSRATSERLSLCSSRKSNVAAIGSGSEIPMDSINR